MASSIRLRIVPANSGPESSSEVPGLPAGLHLTRTTSEFTLATMPKGLRSAHRVADGVWGLLQVRAGTVDYVIEKSGERRTVSSGEAQVIDPGLRHHIEPSEDARFVIEFHG